MNRLPLDPQQEAANIAAYQAGGLPGLAAYMRETGQLSGTDIPTRLRELRALLDARPPSHTEDDMNPESYRWFCSRMGI